MICHTNDGLTRNTAERRITMEENIENGIMNAIEWLATEEIDKDNQDNTNKDPNFDTRSEALKQAESITIDDLFKPVE